MQMNKNKKKKDRNITFIYDLYRCAAVCGRLNLPLSFYKHLLYDQESEGKFFTSYYMDELALFTSCTFYQRGSRSGTVWASVLWHVLMDCRYGRNRLSDTVLPSWDMACTGECDPTVKKVHMLGLSLWMTAADLRCVLPGLQIMVRDWQQTMWTGRATGSSHYAIP